MVTPILTEKLGRLRRIVSDMESVLVAFSGGIDSTLVLKVAHDELGSNAVGITAVSATYPSLELESAVRSAREIGVPHEVVSTDQLAIPAFAENDASRCFHCKTDLYRLMEALRAARPVQWIVDGTNVDDLSDDRPGIKAAREWQVRSPLVEANFTKTDVRAVARSLGLSAWDKPEAACLSSRIPRGVPITVEKLRRVEEAEAVLLSMGVRQVRVRDHGDIARIEVAAEEFARLNEPSVRASLTVRLRKTGFRYICLDLEGYRSGGTELKATPETSPP